MPTVAWVVSKTANDLPVFRQRIRNDQVVEHSVVHPSFAVDTEDGYDFEWFMDGVSVGTNAPTFTTTDFGDYQVQVTDQNGCQNLSNLLRVIDICSQTPPDSLTTSAAF